MYSILVVDDEVELRKQVCSFLKSQGYQVEQAADGVEAARLLDETQFPLVLCDVKMPRMDGLEFLRYVREKEYSTAVALITAHGNVRDAVDAIQEGAFDYVEKPVNENQILHLVEKAERAHHMLHKIKYSAPRVGESGSECVGQSEPMKRIFQVVERLARVNTSVLIRGENGTGKELVAKGIHYNSQRKDHPFIAVNCAAIPETLIESELFGHEKGAFTGADHRKIGLFQAAAKGTIFLDEIGDMSLTTQVKLLRVLQEHTFTPVGSSRELRADVRVIAATNQDLETLIAEGKFRQDLFYRLNVMPIFLPPLRERREDIPALVHHFIEKFNVEHKSSIQGIAPDALRTLESFDWPGNIRELENAIEHAFVMESSQILSVFSLPEYLRTRTKFTPSPLPVPEPALNDEGTPATEGMDWEKRKERFEREFIIQALRKHSGKINLTSEQSKIPKNTLLRKIKKYNINPREYGHSASFQSDSLL